MKKVELNEILSNEEYIQHRNSIRNDTLAIKGHRPSPKWQSPSEAAQPDAE